MKENRAHNGSKGGKRNGLSPPIAGPGCRNLRRNPVPEYQFRFAHATKQGADLTTLLYPNALPAIGDAGSDPAQIREGVRSTKLKVGGLKEDGSRIRGTTRSASSQRFQPELLRQSHISDCCREGGVVSFFAIGRET